MHMILQKTNAIIKLSVDNDLTGIQNYLLSNSPFYLTCAAFSQTAVNLFKYTTVTTLLKTQPVTDKQFSALKTTNNI